MESRDEQAAKKIMEILVYDAHASFDKLIAKEKDAQPDNKAFFDMLEGSEFFKNLYKRGFTAGANWQRKFSKIDGIVMDFEEEREESQ